MRTNTKTITSEVPGSCFNCLRAESSNFCKLIIHRVHFVVLIEKTQQFINSFLGDVVYDRYETAEIKC
jgi:hypothetical protein